MNAAKLQAIARMRKACPAESVRLPALLLLAALLPATAPAASATRDGDTVVLQNAALKLTLDLKSGARVSEFSYKPFGENIVYPVSSSGGILMDHVWEQTWPGEFLNRRYDAELVKAGPDEAVVRVWTAGTEPTTKGLRFERLISLKDADRAVRCRVSLVNTSALGRVTGYWSQNNFWFGGKENLVWSRPSTRGVDRMGPDWFTYAWYFIDDATAAWNGACNPERRQGLMCLMDFNDLWRIYDNGSAITTEWMYDKVAIPAGKTWSTEIALIPVSGIDGFVHGSSNLVANMVTREVPGGLSIEHSLTRALTGLKAVTVHTRVWGLKKQWAATVPDATLAELTDNVQTLTVKATGVEAMPAGIQVTVTGTTPDGKAVTETYGDYFGGAEGKNNDPFSMKPYLSFERPQKRKVFLKPDVIQYKPNPSPRVLFLRGMWVDQFRVDHALKTALPDAAVEDGWLDASPVGYALSYFPADYPSLLSYDLIVLGNIPAAPLDLVGQEMLKDYLAAGGNLLILGGDQAFGQAGFANQGLTNMLPVDVGGPYNWSRIQGGGMLKVTARHAVTSGVEFGPRDAVYYSHLCVPKPGATVAVTAADRPILVLGTTPGGGRIACVLATPFGEPAEGQTAFWDSKGWRALMENTARWLLVR